MTFTYSRGADGFVPARFAIASQSGVSSNRAKRRCATIETARMAFAPRRDLFGVPSSSIRSLSISSAESKRRPASARAISLFTFSTAWATPPSESRSSQASCEPVLLPDVTEAVADIVLAYRVASTVGLPRVSRIVLASTWSICILLRELLFKLRDLFDSLYY